MHPTEDGAPLPSPGESLTLPKLSLFRLDEITYEEKAPRREAMENIIGTFRHMKGVHFVYLILARRPASAFTSRCQGLKLQGSDL